MDKKDYYFFYFDEPKEIETENEDDGIKMTRYAVTSYRTDRSVENLIKWRNTNKLIIPHFQRKYVWNYKNSVRLIETILLGLPIPDIFVYRDLNNNQEKYQLIDGLQRIETIRQFKEGTWENDKHKKRKFIITNKASQWYKKSYADLNNEDKNYFNDYSLTLTIFNSTVESESKRKLYMADVFSRINTGSIKLTDQEIRNAVYPGDALKRIREIASSDYFKKLTAKDENIQFRDKNEEVILRFATYYFIYKKYSTAQNKFIQTEEDTFNSSKNEMLGNFLLYSNCKKIEYGDILNKVEGAIKLLSEIDINAFYGRTSNNERLSKRVHEIFAEALVISLIELNQKPIDGEKIENIKKEVWANETYKAYFTVSTTSIENVKKRVDFLKSKLA